MGLVKRDDGLVDAILRRPTWLDGDQPNYDALGELGCSQSEYARAHAEARARVKERREREARAAEALNAVSRIRQARAAVERPEREADEHEKAGRPATAQRIRNEVALGWASRAEKEAWRLEQCAGGDRAELKRLRAAVGLDS